MFFWENWEIQIRTEAIRVTTNYANDSTEIILDKFKPINVNIKINMKESQESKSNL